MNQNQTKYLPVAERPYEKAKELGFASLTDAELLAIILKTGTKDHNSIEVARSLLTGRHENLLNLYEMSLPEMKKLPGIGEIKALQLKAVCELSKRISKESKRELVRLTSTSSVADYYMERLRHLSYETILVAFFNKRNQLIGDAVVSKGGENSAYLFPRDVMRLALEISATSYILLHNHPSGDCNPSMEDIDLTDRMYECGQLMGIPLYDHLIIGDRCYFSFLEHQLLFPK